MSDCSSTRSSETARPPRERSKSPISKSAKILHRAQRHLPANLPFRHVHGGEVAPRRRTAGKIGRRLNKAAVQAIRRAQLVAVIAVFGVRGAIVIFFTGNQTGDGNEVVRVGDEDAAFGIEAREGRIITVPTSLESGNTSVERWQNQNHHPVSQRQGPKNYGIVHPPALLRPIQHVFFSGGFEAGVSTAVQGLC